MCGAISSPWRLELLCSPLMGNLLQGRRYDIGTHTCPLHFAIVRQLFLAIYNSNRMCWYLREITDSRDEHIDWLRVATLLLCCKYRFLLFQAEQHHKAFYILTMDACVRGIKMWYTYSNCRCWNSSPDVWKREVHSEWHGISFSMTSKSTSTILTNCTAANT